MVSRFEQRFQSFASPVLDREFGVTVTIYRDGESSGEFTARRSLSTDYGLDVKVSMRDFILPVSGLVINGVTITPEAGDQIFEGDHVYELQPLESGKLAAELLPGGFDYLAHAVEFELIVETVALYGPAENDVRKIADALVSLERASFSRSSGPVERSGVMRLRAADLTKATQAHTVLIRSETWDIISVGEVVNGLFLVSISRQDDDHTNTFDMSNRQATWNG